MQVMAVNEWLRSDKTFHIMRDHPSHNGERQFDCHLILLATMLRCMVNVPGYILAGLWGGKVQNDSIRDQWTEMGQAIFSSVPRSPWDFDQTLLRRIVWPYARRDAVQHDAYFCHYFQQFQPVRPFPTRRVQRSYVGWGPVRSNLTQTGITECPVRCRPKEHWLDWEFC